MLEVCVQSSKLARSDLSIVRYSSNKNNLLPDLEVTCFNLREICDKPSLDTHCIHTPHPHTCLLASGRYAVIRFNQYFKVKPQVSALEMPK